MRDKLYAYLLDRPGGARPAELLDLIFTQPARDAEFGPHFLRTLLEEDSRFVWRADDGVWSARVHEALAHRLEETTFVVIDVETTGGSVGDTAIVEVAAARVHGGRIVEEFEQLVNPGCQMPPFVSRLTGITDEMLAGQPSVAETLPHWQAFIGDDVIVAHNAPFDLGVLNTVALVHGRDDLTNPHLCSLKLSRRLFPELHRRSLDALAAHFGVPVADRHRAMSDVRITTEIFFHLLEAMRGRGIKHLHEALDLQHAARDGRRFTCGLSRAAVRQLPNAPGVYRFFDESGRLLYIGRAKNLRQRVGSYMSNAGGHSDKTLDLIRHARDVRVQLAGSPLEAALDEAAAIRREKPPYNRLGKHLPRSAFLRLGLGDPYPRISVVRKPGRGRARLVGPFADRKEAERVLDLLTRLFQLRTCAGPLKPDPTVAPCFQGQVNACTAPCAAKVTGEAYRRQVEACLACLDGEVEPIRERLRLRREEQSAAANFEGAASTQRDLETLRRLLRRQRTLGWISERQNFLVLQPTVTGDAVLAYLVLAGRLVWRGRLHDESHVDQIARLVDDEQQAAAPGLPTEQIDGTTILAAWLRDRTEGDGYVFRFDAAEAPATRVSEWRAACTSLLAAPAVDRAPGR